MFSKAASEGGRQEDRKRKDGRQEEKGQSSKKGRNEAVRRERTKQKNPLIQITNNLFLRHYDKYNIYIL